MTDSLLETARLTAPLRGCLYCHAEGSTSISEGRKVLGLGGSSPLLVCNACNAVAQFEVGEDQDDWRIRYRSVSRASRYYYVWFYLGQAGWLDSDAALEESRRGFIQRLRVQQVQHGNLAWLRPGRLASPPALMSPDEQIYATLNPASLHQGSRKPRTVMRSGDDPIQDVGRFYLTDQKLHLLGKRRDWSHRLSDVQRVDLSEHYWRAWVGDTGQYYQGKNLHDQIDAQLMAAIIREVTHSRDNHDE